MKHTIASNQQYKQIEIEIYRFCFCFFTVCMIEKTRETQPKMQKHIASIGEMIVRDSIIITGIPTIKVAIISPTPPIVELSQSTIDIKKDSIITSLTQSFCYFSKH